MKLRAYQGEAGQAWLSLVSAKPDARGVIAAATGTGKTRLGLFLCREMGRAAWVADRQELLDQTLAQYRRFFPEADAGLVKAGADGVGAADLVVVSRQTVERQARLDRLAGSGPFDLVVLDECDVAPRSIVRIMDALGAPALGLTATPERSDGLGLATLFPDGMVYSFPIRRAVEEGWLVPPVDLAGRPWRGERVVVPGLHPDALRKRVGADLGREPDDDELEEAFGEFAAGSAVDACRLALDAGRERVICFAASIKMARAVAEALGPEAAWCSGETPDRERRATLARLRAGELRVVVNCALWVRGLDVPEIDAMVMARAVQSRPWYVQAAGRCLRPVCRCGKIMNGAPCSCGKTNALIVDLVGAHDAHGLVTVDALGDYDPGLDGGVRGTGSSPQFVERPDNPRLARLYNYLRAVAGEGVVGSAPPGSDHVWLPVDPGRCYVLPAGDAGSVLLELAGVDDGGTETWRVVHEPRDRHEPPELLAVVAGDGAAGVEAAQERGEREAAHLGAGRLAQRGARWRAAEPTDGQLQALAKWRVWQRPRTAGEAADLLTLAASRGRWKARQKGKRDPVNPWAPW